MNRRRGGCAADGVDFVSNQPGGYRGRGLMSQCPNVATSWLRRQSSTTKRTSWPTKTPSAYILAVPSGVPSLPSPIKEPSLLELLRHIYFPLLSLDSRASRMPKGLKSTIGHWRRGMHGKKV
ncbi:uncharacterized protein [Dermacentor albipictus]|uniref:uncharacterized protein isoform X3 n=1 Tax=Dermacentor albipictus TaxID=60249 RepID=UPI0038FC0387